MSSEYERPTVWTGCLGPLLRSWFLVAVTFIIAAIVGVMLQSWWWFIGVAIALTVIVDVIDRRFWKKRDTALRRRFFGLEPDDPNRP